MDLWTQWGREWLGWIEKVASTYVYYRVRLIAGVAQGAQTGALWWLGGMGWEKVRETREREDV